MNKKSINASIWQKKNPEKVRAYYRKRYDKARMECLNYYSKGRFCCNLCGYNDIRALAIDHINGDGHEHRKEQQGGKIVFWLRRNGFPNGFQILCHNCNWIKRLEEYSNRKL